MEISELLDCLLIEIISRLPTTEEAIRTVKAELDYEKRGHAETKRKVAEEEILKGLLLKLSHVKELKIGNSCQKVLSRLEAKGFTLPLDMKYHDFIPLPFWKGF
nr:hypothetical protein [Tanacetum cinerariifolium]